MDGLIVDGLISLSHSLSHSHSHSLSHSHSHTLCPEGGGAARRLPPGGAGAFGARPPCVDSFMDGCVAVSVAVAETVAEAVAVAVAEAETVAVAVAEINPSTINPPRSAF